MLGNIPGVHGALALTESLIAAGCAPHNIFLLVAIENAVNPLLKNNTLLKLIGEHRGAGVYCVADGTDSTGSIQDHAARHQRFTQLIERFVMQFPKDWDFHHDHVKEGSPMSVVHLEEPADDEAKIARTVLAHSVTRLQISDLPKAPGTA